MACHILFIDEKRIDCSQITYQTIEQDSLNFLVRVEILFQHHIVTQRWCCREPNRVVTALCLGPDLTGGRIISKIDTKCGVQAPLN